MRGFWGTYPAVRAFYLGIALTVLFTHSSVWGRDASSDDVANARLAYKLKQLSKSLDLREGRYEDSAGDEPKNFNRNDGNTYLSNTTYHSYVWDYCQQWVGNQRCNEWIPAFVSKHGQNSDRSPLEAVVWDDFQQNKGQLQQNGNNSQYAIWDITTRGGSPLDRFGRIDDTNITNWKIKPQLEQKIEQLGERTAQRNIDATMDPNVQAKAGSAGGEELTSMESLRFMAERWTKMYRNRLLANLGEERVARKPIEFALGENRPTCDSYLDALRQQQQATTGGRRLTAQGQLEMETRTKQLEQRYNLCVQMRQQAGSQVNPQVVGNGIQAGSPDTERGAEWRNRVNLAVVDSAGTNPNDVPHPSDVQIAKSEYTTNLKQYEAGGLNYKTVGKTNLDQLNGYNSVLTTAAEGVKAAAARNPFMADYSTDVVNRQIQPGTRGLVDINGMTDSMKENLAATGLPRTAPADVKKDPAKNLESTPGELVVTKIQ